MWKKKNFVFLLIYTLLFSALIFVWRSIFFPSSSYEERYIEPTLDGYNSSDREEHYKSFSGVSKTDVNTAVHDLIYKEFAHKHSVKLKEKVDFRYIPSILREKLEHSYTPIMETFFYSWNILNSIEKLWVFIYKNKGDTRGRMKSKHIYMYWVERMSLEEFIGVMIHEFAHYVDIYHLPKSAFGDESQRFYDISWDSVSRIKSWQKWQDFVSGYAMTNQYEDFAESYLYYVLHNKEFLEKTKQSDALGKKYAFLQTYIFPRNLFYKESFSLEQDVKDYYWDITKLRIDMKKFLQYMQSDI